MMQPDAFRMIQRRARQAGIKTHIGNHSLRATGITDYLKNAGTLENAQQMANHSSPRTTKLYGRRNDETSLAGFRQIAIGHHYDFFKTPNVVTQASGHTARGAAVLAYESSN
jgi:site-specific recombinase XerD